MWSAAAAALPRLPVDSGLLEPDRQADLRILVIGDDTRRPSASSPVVTAGRADSISVWVVRHGKTRVLAVPRDLRVHVPGRGDQKLSGTLDYGASATVAAVDQLLDIRISHVVDVDFAGFQRAVDVLGGIDLKIRAAIRDPTVGLQLDPGPQHLDGSTALAYVRARTPEVLLNGTWRTAAGDLGRLTRQQQVATAMLTSIRGQSPMWTVAHAGALAGAGLRVDAGMDAELVQRIGGSLASSNVAFCLLPTRWQVPDTEATSPFDGSRPGSVNYRVLAPDAGVALDWLVGPGGIPPPDACASPVEDG